MPPTRRRTVLGLGASVAATGALAGCGVRFGEPVTPAEQTASADQQARDRLGDLLDQLAAATSAAAERGPRADRSALRAVAAEQIQQARALRPAPASPTTATATAGVPTARDLRTGARRVRTSVLAALPAVSGPVARLLASCAAGLTLHDRVLAGLEDGT